LSATASNLGVNFISTIPPNYIQRKEIIIIVYFHILQGNSFIAASQRVSATLPQSGKEAAEPSPCFRSRRSDERAAVIEHIFYTSQRLSCSSGSHSPVRHQCKEATKPPRF
jgi:hypothetical protein